MCRSMGRGGAGAAGLRGTGGAPHPDRLSVPHRPGSGMGRRTLFDDADRWGLSDDRVHPPSLGEPRRDPSLHFHHHFHHHHLRRHRRRHFHNNHPHHHHHHHYFILNDTNFTLNSFLSRCFSHFPPVAPDFFISSTQPAPFLKSHNRIPPPVRVCLQAADRV